MSQYALSCSSSDPLSAASNHAAALAIKYNIDSLLFIVQMLFFGVAGMAVIGGPFYSWVWRAFLFVGLAGVTIFAV